MRLLLILPLLAATALTAQTLEIHPGVVSYVSRGNFGVGAGELLQGFHESHWKGIGDTGAGAFLNGVRIQTQDQNASSQETYDLVVRLGTDAAGPTTGVAGEACVVPGLMTPFIAGNAGAAWLITTNFGTPCRIPPKGHFAVGVRLTANLGWSLTDGQSMAMADPSVQQAGPHQGDHAWQIIGAAPTAVHFVAKRSLRVALLTSTPVLQNGVFATTTATYAKGMGGMFPRIGTHGWSTHINAGTAFAGGVTGIFMSPVVVNPGLVLPGIRGSVYLGAPLIAIATLPLSATGTADLSVIDPIGTYTITVHMQAIVVDSGLTAIALTNVNSTTFQ